MESLMDLKQVQEDLEEDMRIGGIDRFHKSNDRASESGEASTTSWYRRLTKSFVEPYAEGIQAYCDHYLIGSGKGRGNTAVALRYIPLLDPKVTAYIAIKVIFDNLTHDSITIQSVCDKIGSKLEDQVRFSKLEKAAKRYVQKVQTSLAQNNSSNYQHKKKVYSHVEDKLSKDEGAYKDAVNKWIDWPATDRVHIGAMLVRIFTESVQYGGESIIKKEVVNIARMRGQYKSSARFVPAPSIVGWIDEFKEVLQEISPCYAPCVIPPRDWVSPTVGGYHTPKVAKTVHLVKINDKEVEKSYTRDSMPKVYNAINALQRTEWSINSRVLSIAQDVINKDLALAIPQREPYEPNPCPVGPEFSHLRGVELQEVIGPHAWGEFKAWKSEMAMMHTANKERISKYINVNRVISQARVYSKYESLYFVYTMDFRGRFYAQSSLLSPQGADIQKALLHFKNPAPLKDDGMYWLAVHGANLLGEWDGTKIDKLDFESRVKFIHKMELQIVEIANNPLKNRGWAGADKPWQFLAWCSEWRDLYYHRAAGNRHEVYNCRLPVSMDGSCSGIQHYSAMLRDPVGGVAVNLVPSDEPKDIYQTVANIVEVKMQEISKTGDEYERELAQLWLDVGISRGLTKKPVMTLPYGSTQMTCRDQIESYLNELQDKENRRAKAEVREPRYVHPFNTGKYSTFKAVIFCSRVVWSSIGDVVVAARTCMDYITDMAKQRAKDNLPLVWSTPSGFNVNQKIYNTKSKRITTFLMGRTDLSINYTTDSLNVKKMKTASAPNFVHSMDACHLALTVNKMQEEGISNITVVHDSFGTNAGGVSRMREILREEFVKMYKDNDVLRSLLNSNDPEELYGIELLDELGLDLNVVLRSTYFFS